MGKKRTRKTVVSKGQRRNIVAGVKRRFAKHEVKAKLLLINSKHGVKDRIHGLLFLVQARSVA